MKQFQNNWVNYLEIVEIPENMAVGAVSYALERAVGDRGSKVFELSNHLGNVLATVSDKKLGRVLDSTSFVAAYYEGQVHSVQDYYAFGWGIPSRSFSGDTYRYGYQGSEKNKEQNGSYTTFYRQLDTRIGRWLSVDPMFQAHQSPYSSMDNNPIIYIDPMGDKITYDKPNSSMSKKEKRALRRFNTRMRFNVFLMRTFGNKRLRGRVTALAKSKDFVLTISPSDFATIPKTHYDRGARTVYVPLETKGSKSLLLPSKNNPTDFIIGSDIGSLANELFHAWIDKETTILPTDNSDEKEKKNRLYMSVYATKTPDFLYPKDHKSDLTVNERMSNESQNDALRILGKKERLENTHAGYRAKSSIKARTIMKKLKKLNKLSPIDLSKPGARKKLMNRKVEIIEKYG